MRAHLDQPQWRVHRRQQCRHRRLPKTPPHWRSLPSMAVCAKGHTPPFLRRGTVTPRLKAPFLGQKTFVGAPSRWRNPSLPMERASGIRRARALAARGRAHQTGGGAGRPKFRPSGTPAGLVGSATRSKRPRTPNPARAFHWQRRISPTRRGTNESLLS